MDRTVQHSPWSYSCKLKVGYNSRRTQGERAKAIGGLFGIDLKRPPVRVEKKELELTFRSGEITYVTGPSGDGKSTLIEETRQRLNKLKKVTCINCSEVDAFDFSSSQLVINRLGEDVTQAMGYLAKAGLGDASLMLRQVNQLSGGEQMRLLIAKMIELGELYSRNQVVMLFDEFTSVLDRLTAKVVSRQIRKWVSRTGVHLMVGTAHDDLVESLKPDVMVYAQDGDYEVVDVSLG